MPDQGKGTGTLPAVGHGKPHFSCYIMARVSNWQSLSTVRTKSDNQHTLCSTHLRKTWREIPGGRFEKTQPWYLPSNQYSNVAAVSSYTSPTTCSPAPIQIQNARAAIKKHIWCKAWAGTKCVRRAPRVHHSRQVLYGTRFSHAYLSLLEIEDRRGRGDGREAWSFACLYRARR